MERSLPTEAADERLAKSTKPLLLEALDLNADPVAGGKLKGLRRTDLRTPILVRRIAASWTADEADLLPVGWNHDFCAVKRMVHETPACGIFAFFPGEFPRKCSSLRSGQS
jgi:hypothetical protein